MRFHEMLTEGRDAPLYHATTVKAALEIIRNDRIEARTPQLIGGRRGKRIKMAKSERYGQTYGYKMSGGERLEGVSLTRSYEFALNWLRSDVVFVLDQQALGQRNKIIPVDHTNNGPYDYDGIGFEHMEQAEEFVVGPITSLSTCLRSINVRLADLDRVTLETFVDERALWGNALLNRWYQTSHRNQYDRGHYEAEYDTGSFLHKTYRKMRKQGKSVTEVIAYMRHHAALDTFGLKQDAPAE